MEAFDRIAEELSDGQLTVKFSQTNDDRYPVAVFVRGRDAFGHRRIIMRELNSKMALDLKGTRQYVEFLVGEFKLRFVERMGTMLAREVRGETT